jgi:hypothetical protein
MGKQWRGAGDWAFGLPRAVGDAPPGAEGSRLVLWGRNRKAWRHAARPPPELRKTA